MQSCISLTFFVIIFYLRILVAYIVCLSMLQAVYGGRISVSHEKGVKMNPMFSEAPPSDMHSPIHMTTYETFPRVRDRDSLEPRTGSLKSGDTSSLKQNGHLKNGHILTNGSLIHAAGNILVDNNRNKLSPIRSSNRYLDTGQSSEVIVMGVLQKETLPRLLGPDDVPILSENLKNAQHDQCLHHIAQTEPTRQCNGIDNETTLSDVHLEIDDNSASVIENVRKSKVNGAFQMLSYNNEGFVHDESNDVENPKSDLQEHNQRNKERSYMDVTTHVINESGLTIITNDDLGISEDEGEDKEPHEIVTEVIVHTVPEHPVGVTWEAPMYSRVDRVCHSLDGAGDDWPDLDTIVRNGELPDDLSADGEDSGTAGKGHVCEVHGSSPDLLDPHAEREAEDSGYETIGKLTDNDEKDKNGNEASVEARDKESKYKKNSKGKSVKISSKTSTTNDGSTRTLKSILSTSSNASQCSCSQNGESRHSDSETEIQEVKSVKFAEDTVFNENKSNRYKQEKLARINLREIYRGKIVSEAAMAKMNPVFSDDEGKTGSLTDDEKMSYETTLKEVMALTKGKVSLIICFIFSFYVVYVN